MAKTFQVDIVTPEAVIWSGEADMVSARTTEGDIGVLADYEPTMAALATGAVTIHRDGKVTAAGIHGGFLQIFKNHVTLLTDSAQLTEYDVLTTSRRTSAAIPPPTAPVPDRWKRLGIAGPTVVMTVILVFLWNSPAMGNARGGHRLNRPIRGVSTLIVDLGALRGCLAARDVS